MLTVGELRKLIADVPDDVPVLVDFLTTYDGTRVEKNGKGTHVYFFAEDRRRMGPAGPHVLIDASDNHL